MKIDRSFIDGLPSDAKDRAIVEAVAALVHTLKLTLVAEGVETADQIALHALRCHRAQGFRIGRPDDAAAITAVLLADRATATASPRVPEPLR